MSLRGLTAIITGATSEIGRETAKLFAAEGAKVAVVGRNEGRGNQVIAEIKQSGGEAEFFKAEMTSEPEVKQMIENVAASFGGIDILINNAGLVIPGTIPEIGLEDWEKTWNANVTSAYLASHYALPHMLAKKNGAIVDISSEAGLKGFKARAAYCTAKFAIVGLTKSMAVDHSGDGIRVNCLCPGTVETEMVRNVIEKSANPEQTRNMLIERRLTPFIGQPDEIARAILFLADPENKYITGAVLSVDGGSTVK
jgi:NAD(P)-dependent dehydrogenase (short-subunit alcohol dehydrogenase family)